MESVRLSVQNCDFCGSSDYKVLKPARSSEGNADFAFAGSSAKLTQALLRCVECDLIQTLQVLKNEELIKGYENNVDEIHDSQFSVRCNTFFRALNRLLNEVRVEPEGRSTLIDIGCSSGAILCASNRLGIDAIGLEPSESLVKQGRARGLEIHKGILPDPKFRNRKFSFVSSWDVIEHVSSPRSFIESLKELCDAKTFLILNTPNYDSWQRKLLGNYWPFFLEVHLFYFTPETIAKLLSDSGFEVEFIGNHVQCLELGYLINRYFPKLRLPNIISRIPIWYSMGQMSVIARVLR
jgi:2-polyprenyl-3-methyl-5-hydroxy-6-metoxy-1,4-benzoquinol methylase